MVFLGTLMNQFCTQTNCDTEKYKQKERSGGHQM